MPKLLSRLFSCALLMATGSCLEPLDPASSTCDNSQLAITILNVKSTECGIPNGEIEVQAFGGAGKKQYFLNGGTAQDTGYFNSLRPGIYAVTVTDSLYCSRSVTVQLSSGISFNKSILPIIQKSCAIPTCHDGSGSISFNVFSNIKKSALDIKGLTQARIMPKVGTLTNEEIEKIVCWVDDGALFN